MQTFTPAGKAAIEKILQCMKDANEAFASLTDVENMECFEFHGEGTSLNHCIRWGLTAAEEIQTKLSEQNDLRHRP